jgi:hypothetical protein
MAVNERSFRYYSDCDYGGVVSAAEEAALANSQEPGTASSPVAEKLARMGQALAHVVSLRV